MTQNRGRPEKDTEGIRRGSREPQGGQSAAGAGPLVTVVIPCYNQAHFLGEAIESVLAQSYPHFEVVVVDDGSTDETSKVAERYPGVRCIRQENRGLSGARNSGLARSEGEYVVFSDADDRLVPEALEVGVEQLSAHPGCALVAGHCRFIALDGSLVKWQQPLVERDHYGVLLGGNNYIWMPAEVMYRRAVFETVGGFDTSMNAAADYDLYLRIAREFPIHCHDRVVADYRQHDTSMSRNSALMLKAVLAVLRSQRKYVKGNTQHKEAYKAGMRFWRKDYGDPLVEEVRAHVREREWKQAIRGMLVLLRYYPLGFSLKNERRRLAQELKARKRRLQDREQLLRDREGRLRELESTLVEERQEARRLRKRAQRLAQDVQNFEKQLQSMQGPRTRRLLRRLGRIRPKALSKSRGAQ